VSISAFDPLIRGGNGTVIAEERIAKAINVRQGDLIAMIMTNRILPVALVAALIGGSVGAFVMHSRNPTTAEAQTGATLDTTGNADARDAQYQANLSAQPAKGEFIPAEFETASEQGAYKSGFADGFAACGAGSSSSRVAPAALAATQRTVYRNTGRNARSSSSSSSSRRVYYDYNQQPRSRTFWQKHRDKLTVAMGTGGGAIIGGLIGGKKGAAIGALGGAGGSALYTYKLRNRNRRY
jgi:hypothetical protein